MDSARPSRTVLVIGHQFPKPDQDAGSLRALNILKILRKAGFEIWYFSQALEDPSRYTRELEAIGVRCIYAKQDGPLKRFLINSGVVFDVVILSHAPIAKAYLSPIRRLLPNAMVVFDTVDLYFLRESREASLLSSTESVFRRWSRRFAVHRRKVSELAAARTADITWVVSDWEREILRKEDPKIRTEVVSIIVPPKPTRAPFSVRADIVFLGGYAHTPNVDAARYYVEEIHPLVREKLPSARLYLLGSSPPDMVRSLSNEDIVVTGHVPDLKPYYERIRVSIVPLRYGAGVKGKINTSFSFGVPVVTTPAGAEGMDLVHEKHALIVEKPSDFAEALFRLYTDETLWISLRKAGLEHLRRMYSFDRAAQAIAASFNAEINGRWYADKWAPRSLPSSSTVTTRSKKY